MTSDFWLGVAAAVSLSIIAFNFCRIVRDIQNEIGYVERTNIELRSEIAEQRAEIEKLKNKDV